MRKITWLLLLVGFLVFAQTLSSPVASGVSKPIQATADAVIVGNISIRSAQNGNIVLIIDSAVAGAADGLPDLIVRFAPRKKRVEYQNLYIDLNAARLFFSDRRVAIIGSDGATWVSLSLEPVKREDPSFGLYGDASTDVAQTIRISKGYALQRQTPNPVEDASLASVDLERSIVADRRQGMRIQDDEQRGPPPCDAGGQGASQCSYSCGGQSCSVTCGGGMYACCFCSSSIPYCKCRI